MRTSYRYVVFIVFAALLLCTNLQAAQPSTDTTETDQKPAVTLQPEVGKTMLERAGRVKEDLASQARSLFHRTPLGWNLETLQDIYRWMIGLPLQMPHLVQKIMEQGRILGVAGSLLVLTFIGAIIYSLIGRNRVLARLVRLLQPLEKKLPEALYPFFISLMKVLVSALIPLILLGGFSLIDAFIKYQAAWFQLTGRFLGLWAVGALLIGILREALTENLFPRTAAYGKRVFKLSRLVLFYVLAGIAVIWAAQAFQIRADIVAFLQFVISISIVVVLFLLHMMKKNPDVAAARFAVSSLSGVRPVNAPVLLSLYCLLLRRCAALVSWLPAVREGGPAEDLVNRRCVSAHHAGLSHFAGLAQ